MPTPPIPPRTAAPKPPEPTPWDGTEDLRILDASSEPAAPTDFTAAPATKAAPPQAGAATDFESLFRPEREIEGTRFAAERSAFLAASAAPSPPARRVGLSSTATTPARVAPPLSGVGAALPKANQNPQEPPGK